METNHSLNQTAAPQQEDRSGLLKDLANLSLQATSGEGRINEQEIGQLLGGLVRTKLMTADDTYHLRDRLLDRSAIERAIDLRIEAALTRHGLISDDTHPKGA